MYEEKVLKAISLARNIDDLIYIKNKISKSSQINRRTVSGRNLTNKLVSLVNKTIDKRAENGELPF